MKKHIVSVVVAVMLLVPSMALAHGAHKHKTVMGTVQSIDASHIDVTTREGKKVSVPLKKDTSFMRGDEKVTSAQVKAGTRVVIQLGEGDKSAQSVKIGGIAKKK